MNKSPRPDNNNNKQTIETHYEEFKHPNMMTDNAAPQKRDTEESDQRGCSYYFQKFDE